MSFSPPESVPELKFVPVKKDLNLTLISEPNRSIPLLIVELGDHTDIGCRAYRPLETKQFSRSSDSFSSQEKENSVALPDRYLLTDDKLTSIYVIFHFKLLMHPNQTH